MKSLARKERPVEGAPLSREAFLFGKRPGTSASRLGRRRRVRGIGVVAEWQGTRLTTAGRGASCERQTAPHGFDPHPLRCWGPTLLYRGLEPLISPWAFSAFFGGCSSTGFCTWGRRGVAPSYRGEPTRARSARTDSPKAELSPYLGVYTLR